MTVLDFVSVNPHIYKSYGSYIVIQDLKACYCVVMFSHSHIQCPQLANKKMFDLFLFSCEYL